MPRSRISATEVKSAHPTEANGGNNETFGTQSRTEKC